MPKRGFTGKLGLRCDEKTTAILIAIEANHRIAPVEFVRSLIDAACEFHRKHGWFSFPVVIEPLEFHKKSKWPTRAELEAASRLPPPAVSINPWPQVNEEQAKYGGDDAAAAAPTRKKKPTRPKSGPAGAAAVLHRLKPGANAGAASA